ncbi:ATP-binding protein [Hyphomonas sp.]|uniref:PAS domain-containing hybrid sensor histidine kinase/response regulator n=1 Tax=Hyphomonas sp. TaxID=87 RepID=UPI0025C18E6C|nr:ATP-binding protein [Hyphomonas sp.]
MDTNLLDKLPIVVCETAPVRNEFGEIIDLEWVAANQLMNESILPDGGTIVGMRIFEFDPAYRDSEMVRCVLDVINTGEPRTLITQKGRAARMLGKVMKTMIIPTERGALSCSHEITDIAAERDDARRRFELARAACDNALNGIILSDNNSKVLYVNRAVCDLLEYAPEEVVGENIGVLFGVKTLDAVRAFGKSTVGEIERGENIRLERDTEAVTKTGERIKVQFSTSSTPWGDTGETLFITVLRDVREERRKAHELRDALHRAEQATRLKSEFLANMSHEIRTPLNGVLGMAQVLAHSNLTPAQNEQVGVILDSGNTLMVLLNDILDLSKIEAGRMEVSNVASDLRHKLSGLFKLHEASAREKGISIQLFIHPSVPSRLMFDPVRVRQCVGNLVSNAIKFTAEGEVMIVVSSELVADAQHKVTIHVSDSGCGIAADKMDRVFESFAQEDGSTTRRFGGTGLGLSITRKLARMMGGDVTAVSQAGKGSVFTLTFLAEASNSVMKETINNVAPSLSRKPRIGLTGCRALVVDDNAINRRVARSFLEIHGLHISEAADGNEALEVLAMDKYDIVLMDIHMPGLDGAEAFKRLRTSGSANRLTPVIALTADSMHGDREKFLSKGFDGYVSKPIDERSLVTAITQILSLPDEQVRTMLQAG